MAATRGKRLDSSVLSAKPKAKAPATYVCGSKPLPFGKFTLTAGVEVPDAGGWPRIESWVNARRVRKVEPGEKFITFAEFTKEG
jgi:hypothetical protein